jgi:FtsZ-binding cell division protein ZapB
MDTDILNRLEEKVRAAVEKMEELRQENRRLTRKLKGSSGKGSAGKASAAQNNGAEKELRLLQEERAAVRSRIESLIDWMEAAS